jgi:hypothetical protein
MVASKAMPLLDRLAVMRERVEKLSADKKALALPLLEQGEALLEGVTSEAEALVQAAETRRSGGSVDTTSILADERAVVAAERKLVPILTKLFEILGVGEGDELIDVFPPTGGTVRCVRRGDVAVPIGRVSVFLTGLVPRAHMEELRDINKRLQGGERDQAIRRDLEKRRKEIVNREKHNYERSQEMWESIQSAGRDDSVESVNAILSVLLDGGAAPELAQELTVPGTTGNLILEPVWRSDRLPTGERYLNTVIITGVTSPSGG